MKTPSRPTIITAREKAPEVTALVHSNSVTTGLKKTPKAVCMPKIIIMLKKADTTMT
jgi:hypothetical protein